MPVTNATQNVTTAAVLIGRPGKGRAHLSVRNPTGSGATIHLGGENLLADGSNATFSLLAGDPPFIATEESAALEWFYVAAAGTATGVKRSEGR